MSLVQIRVVFGLLAAVHVAFLLLLSPINLPAEFGPAGQRFLMMVMGALVAQPGLIALWAGLAPQAFMRRWAQALAMLLCFDLALAFASANNASARAGTEEMLEIVAWLVAVVAGQLPLWFLRRRFGWRIEPPPEHARPADERGNQFSMIHLLAAMAVVAAFLAALRWIYPNASSARLPEHLLRFAAIGAMTSLVGLLPLAVCWLVLLPGRGGFWRWSIGLGGAGIFAATAAAVAAFGSPGEVGELIFILSGTVLWSAGNLFIVRLCGYRLVRRRAGATGQEASIVLQSAASTNRRFASAVVPLALTLLAMAPLAPGRARLWREKEMARRWRESGLIVLQTSGEITTVICDEGAWLVADAVERINACSQLRHLDLSGSDAGDATLAGLGNLPQLAGLEVCGTRIGDAGAEQLGKFRALRQLNLSMTDVTDDCLVILAGLKSLQTVDLSHTRVTPEGIDWLKQMQLGIEIRSTTDDNSLRRLVERFRRRRTLLSPDAASPPPPLRFRATGPQVTDAGAAALGGMTRIEELDLTDADVTDAAVKVLATLKSLKTLTLIGTRITDSGIVELQARLPDCRIVRNGVEAP